MKVLELNEIPKRDTHDEERCAEIEAFLKTGAQACEVERYGKDLSTDYNRYKNLLWRLGLHEQMKIFTRQGRVFIRKGRTDYENRRAD